MFDYIPDFPWIGLTCAAIGGFIGNYLFGQLHGFQIYFEWDHEFLYYAFTGGGGLIGGALYLIVTAGLEKIFGRKE